MSLIALISYPVSAFLGEWAPRGREGDRSRLARLTKARGNHRQPANKTTVNPVKGSQTARQQDKEALGSEHDHCWPDGGWSQRALIVNEGAGSNFVRAPVGKRAIYRRPVEKFEDALLRITPLSFRIAVVDAWCDTSEDHAVRSTTGTGARGATNCIDRNPEPQVLDASDLATALRAPKTLSAFTRPAEIDPNEDSCPTQPCLRSTYHVRSDPYAGPASSRDLSNAI